MLVQRLHGRKENKMIIKTRTCLKDGCFLYNSAFVVCKNMLNCSFTDVYSSGELITKFTAIMLLSTT